MDSRRSAVVEILFSLNKYVDACSKIAWNPAADGILPLICSSIIKRQYECMSITVDLVEKSQGYAAVGLLRPSCEEMMWAKYLASLSWEDANALVELMGRLEINDSLKAQDDYFGRRATQKLGLENHFAGFQAATKDNIKNLKQLGEKLRWDKRTIDNGKLPSIAFIAKTIGEQRLYNFLYHASSRYVHFSPIELLRRAWGKTGAVTVSSSHFSAYWGEFVLHWGTKLLIQTFLEIQPLIKLPPSEELAFDDSFIPSIKKFAEFGHVPIVTKEELEWESKSTPPLNRAMRRKIKR